MYAVYTGGQVMRSGLPCIHRKSRSDGLPAWGGIVSVGGVGAGDLQGTVSPPTRLDCQRMAISVISAYQLAISRESPIDTAGVGARTSRSRSRIRRPDP